MYSINLNMYKLIIRDIMEISDILLYYKETKIPQVFTIPDPIDPYKPNHHHESGDWPGYGTSSSKLENANGCVDVLNSIIEKLEGICVMIDLVYPHEISRDSFKMSMTNQIKDAIRKIREGIETLRKHSLLISSRQSQRSTVTMNIENVNKIKNRFIMLGQSIVSNNFKIPIEFQKEIPGTSIINREELLRINSEVSPVLARFAQPSNIIEIDKNSLISDDTPTPNLEELSESFKKNI